MLFFCQAISRSRPLVSLGHDVVRRGQSATECIDDRLDVVVIEHSLALRHPLCVLSEPAQQVHLVTLVMQSPARQARNLEVRAENRIRGDDTVAPRHARATTPTWVTLDIVPQRELAVPRLVSSTTMPNSGIKTIRSIS